MHINASGGRLERRRSSPVLVLVLAAMVAGCQVAAGTPVPATPGAAPISSASANPGTVPTDPSASDPIASVQPEFSGPLPPPTLGSVQEIAAALAAPQDPEQAVVSMLDELGIGLYNADGTAIRRGTEAADAGFFVYDVEARGLANLLRERDDASRSMSFREFHSALAGLGYEGSAEDLARAYSESFEADPEATISSFVAALATIDVEGRLSSIAAWLLVLDAFIPASPSSSAVAVAGPEWPALAAGRGGWGVSSGRVQAQSRLPRDHARLINRFVAIAAGFELEVAASKDAAHEGHGSLGEEIQIAAAINARPITFTSPVNLNQIVPVATGGGVGGVTVSFRPDDAADRHVDEAFVTMATDTDRNGIATQTYTMKQEVSGGQGQLNKESVAVTASASAAAVLAAVYGASVNNYRLFIRGDMRGRAAFAAEWHGPPTPIEILWTDTYDNNRDTITFHGNLTDIDRTIPGATAYKGTGYATGTRDGWAACNPGIDDVPQGTVTATFMGSVADGKISIAAFPDWTTSLSGIFAGPFIVPLDELDDFYDELEPSPLLGELCPHNSEAEIYIEDLVLPTP